MKGIRLQRWEVLVEEYGGRDVGGFFNDGRECSSERGRGNVFFVESVSEAMTRFVGLEKTLGILKISFRFPGVF